MYFQWQWNRHYRGQKQANSPMDSENPNFRKEEKKVKEQRQRGAMREYGTSATHPPFYRLLPIALHMQNADSASLLSYRKMERSLHSGWLKA